MSMFWCGVAVGAVAAAGLAASTVVVIAGKWLDSGWPF